MGSCEDDEEARRDAIVEAVVVDCERGLDEGDFAAGSAWELDTENLFGAGVTVVEMEEPGLAERRLAGDAGGAEVPDEDNRFAALVEVGRMTLMVEITRLVGLVDDVDVEDGFGAMLLVRAGLTRTELRLTGVGFSTTGADLGASTVSFWGLDASSFDTSESMTTKSDSEPVDSMVGEDEVFSLIEY